MPDDRGLQLEEQLRSGGLGQVLGGAEVQLGRELHAHGWLVPDVWLHEVGGKTYLEWRFRDDKGNTVTKVPSGSEARGVLDAFIKLRDADPSHILNFAKKSGVLGLCNKHQKPFTHNHRLDVAEPRGYIEQPCLPGRESIARWRELAGEAFRAVCMTAELLSAPPLSHVSVSARLEELARRSRGWNQVIGCAQRWLYESAICWTLLVAGPREGRTQQVVSNPRKLQLVADCPMLFDVLSFQLAQAITRSEGLYLCKSCNQPFFRTWQVSKNQNVFCRDCGRKGQMRIYMRNKRKRVQVNGTTQRG